MNPFLPPRDSQKKKKKKKVRSVSFGSDDKGRGMHWQSRLFQITFLWASSSILESFLLSPDPLTPHLPNGTVKILVSEGKGREVESRSILTPPKHDLACQGAVTCFKAPLGRACTETVKEVMELNRESRNERKNLHQRLARDLLRCLLLLQQQPFTGY